MDVRITPRPLSGTVNVPPSKSMTHRLVIAAALAQGESTIQNTACSQDIEATLRCVEALGARWKRDGATLRIRGVGGRPRERRSDLPRFDCGESGSTLRFLLPVALALAGGGVFTGRGRLMARPQQPYFDLFDEKGIFHELRDGVLTVRGTLTPGEYRLPGNVSSQFFTGLLFALSLLDAPSSLLATTEMESGSYLLMTTQAMVLAGFGSLRTIGGSGALALRPFRYRPFSAAVEGDWSQAAFWYAAAFLDYPVLCQGLKPDTVQGDRIVSDLYWKLARPDTDAEIDLSDCPDLLPPLAVMAANRRGETRFTHAARLRLKESDRLESTAALLRALGGRVSVLPDGLLVHGGTPLSGGTVDGAGDHRIVMAAAVAASACTGPVTILGAEAVDKSYPSFWDDYQKLGGEVCVL
ncbi:MAG: 3-phosphoshikimate 1-carboxyvinyltransferase [Oscillibacter sp.]|jgi:3-phosphoshikimate 1-carboxyvinyltransferase|nr:3-phosphoshikimate 1-carboxyvinyltransferase [Oscillibacter sp.]